jgi:hypothetical protein
MREDRMWTVIGPEKAALLKDCGFDVDLVGHRFFKRGKTAPWILAFEHVEDTPLATLRAELSALPK